MKILFLTLGSIELASSRTRVFQYIPYLREWGAKCKVVVQGERARGKETEVRRLWRKYVLPWMRFVRFLANVFCYDVIFIQKVLIPEWIFILIQWLGKPIVFDFDDAIYTINPSGLSISRDRHRFDHIVKHSNLVVLENEYNRRQVETLGQYNILIITGPIDINRYQPRAKIVNGREVVIGWIGSSTTTPDLELVWPVLRKLVVKYPNVRVELVGATGLLGVEPTYVTIKPWSLDSEVDDLARFDIGIMPLADNEWTRGKGGYKLLQYMAMGIPCVASPVGVNVNIVRDGVNGFLVRSVLEWEQALERLIRDHELRRRMGEEGRRIAIQEYSFEVSVQKLIGALKAIKSYGNKFS